MCVRVSSVEHRDQPRVATDEPTRKGSAKVMKYAKDRNWHFLSRIDSSWMGISSGYSFVLNVPTIYK